MKDRVTEIAYKTAYDYLNEIPASQDIHKTRKKFIEMCDHAFDCALEDQAFECCGVASIAGAEIFKQGSHEIQDKSVSPAP